MVCFKSTLEPALNYDPYASFMVPKFIPTDGFCAFLANILFQRPLHWKLIKHLKNTSKNKQDIGLLRLTFCATTSPQVHILNYQENSEHRLKHGYQSYLNF